MTADTNYTNFINSIHVLEYLVKEVKEKCTWVYFKELNKYLKNTRNMTKKQCKSALVFLDNKFLYRRELPPITKIVYFKSKIKDDYFDREIINYDGWDLFLQNLKSITEEQLNEIIENNKYCFQIDWDKFASEHLRYKSQIAFKKIFDVCRELNIDLSEEHPIYDDWICAYPDSKGRVSNLNNRCMVSVETCYMIFMRTPQYLSKTSVWRRNFGIMIPDVADVTNSQVYAIFDKFNRNDIDYNEPMSDDIKIIGQYAIPLLIKNGEELIIDKNNIHFNNLPLLADFIANKNHDEIVAEMQRINIPLKMVRWGKIVDL